jgi:hypothetical protein
MKVESDTYEECSELRPVVEPTGNQGWEKEDYYRPLPMTNKEVIQSWPEHYEQGLGRNDCLQDLAGSY